MDNIFIQISESRLGRALRTKRWTYGVNAPDKDGLQQWKSDTYVEEFLYDNDKDPHQRNNLVSHPEYQQIREKLAERLKKYIYEVEAIKTIIKPSKTI